MLPCRLAIFLISTALIGMNASAEIYLNIGPLDTLADVKGRFPGATFERFQPAWAHETDHLYRVTGPGIQGVIVVKFTDQLTWYRDMAESQRTQAAWDRYFALAFEKADERDVVEWVRWLPIGSIPLTRLITKYGPPSKKGYADQDLKPFRLWKRGVKAYLSDDEKQVEMIDYYFTKEDFDQYSVGDPPDYKPKRRRPPEK